MNDAKKWFPCWRATHAPDGDVPRAPGYFRLDLVIVVAALWAITVGVAGYAIGLALERFVNDLRAHEWWIAGVLLAGVLALLGSKGRDRMAVRLLRGD